MPPDRPEFEKQKETLMRSVRRHRVVAALVFSLSGVAMLGCLAAQIPFRLEFQAFFDNFVGGVLGDGLQGLTAAILASPPFILGILWFRRRDKRFEYRCVECLMSFALSGVAESVVRDNKCPACGKIVFSSDDISEDVNHVG